MSNRNLFADLSSNNGSGVRIPFYASAGYGAISLKATEDQHYVNPFYQEWVHEAHQHNLAVIHYHFARPEKGNPQAQAEHFWNTVRPHFRRPGDYLFFDIETAPPGVAARWLDEADIHLSGISGTHPGCYAPLSYYTEGRLTVASRRFWIAAWGTQRPGNSRWKLDRGNNLFAWQRTDGIVGSGPHSFAGIPGTCDGSILNPSVAKYLNRVRRSK